MSSCDKLLQKSSIYTLGFHDIPKIVTDTVD